MCRQTSLCAEWDDANALRVSTLASPVHPCKPFVTDYHAPVFTVKDNIQGKMPAPHHSITAGHTQALKVVAKLS